MALLRKSSLAPKQPRPAGVVMNYDEFLRRAEQQKILASEMIKWARQMIDSAVAMRKNPVALILP